MRTNVIVSALVGGFAVFLSGHIGYSLGLALFVFGISCWSDFVEAGPAKAFEEQRQCILQLSAELAKRAEIPTQK